MLNRPHPAFLARQERIKRAPPSWQTSLRSALCCSLICGLLSSDLRAVASLTGLKLFGVQRQRRGFRAGWKFVTKSIKTLCDHGVKVIRLDAFGCFTKKAGSECYFEVSARVPRSVRPQVCCCTFLTGHYTGAVHSNRATVWQVTDHPKRAFPKGGKFRLHESEISATGREILGIHCQMDFTMTSLRLGQ
jgi:hypothetical protein